MAMPWVGHRELRSRGTVCGSLAHADPAAELPAVAACLNAALDIAGPAGRRTVTAREFVTGAMSTVLGPDELLLAARFPVAGPGEGFAFAEIARRHGDFALTGVAIHVSRSPCRRNPGRDPRRLRRLRPPRSPRRDRAAHLRRELLGCHPGEPQAADLARELMPAMSALASELVDTPGDMHASSAYRRRLLTVLAARQLAAAYTRAAGKDPAHAGPTPGRHRASRVGGPDPRLRLPPRSRPPMAASPRTSRSMASR